MTHDNDRTRVLAEAIDLVNGPHGGSAVDGAGYLALGFEVDG